MGVRRLHPKYWQNELLLGIRMEKRQHIRVFSPRAGGVKLFTGSMMLGFSA
jgi:hypothetical protein